VDDNPDRFSDELDEETKEILRERMKTFEQDRKSAVDARQVLRELREKMKRKRQSLLK
jgi:hypothetical protein